MATQMTPDGSISSAACFQNKANEEYLDTEAIKAGMPDLKNYFRLFVIEKYQQKSTDEIPELKNMWARK